MLSALYAIVCPYATWCVKKTVVDSIMQFSPYGSPTPLVFAGKFHPEILTGSPRAGRRTKEIVLKQAIKLHLNVNVSKMLGNTCTSIVTIYD